MKGPCFGQTDAVAKRSVLDESAVHPDIREKVIGFHQDVVAEVAAAVAKDDVVVVGMAQNPHVKRARKRLEEANLAFNYLEYGSYFGAWRPRLALKMWSGWPTFPMVFVKGVLVGGASDVERLLESGDLKNRLGAPRPVES